MANGTYSATQTYWKELSLSLSQLQLTESCTYRIFGQPVPCNSLNYLSTLVSDVPCLAPSVPQRPISTTPRKQLLPSGCRNTTKQHRRMLSAFSFALQQNPSLSRQREMRRICQERPERFPPPWGWREVIKGCRIPPNLIKILLSAQATVQFCYYLVVQMIIRQHTFQKIPYQQSQESHHHEAR